MIAEAEAVSAERICFKTADTFAFATLDTQEILQEINRNLAGRIKYQRVENNRWIDCSTYSFVLDAKQLFADVAAHAFHGKLICDSEQLLAGKTVQPRRFHTALRTILRRLHDSASKTFDVQLVKRIQTAFDSIPTIDDEFFSYFVSTLKCYEILFQKDVKSVIESPEKNNIQLLIAQLENVEGTVSSVGHNVALGNFRAKLLSLVNREAAAREFSATLELDAYNIIEFFYTDMGAFTYFGEADLRPGADKLAADIVTNIEQYDSSYAAAPTALVMSADPRFFRIYGHKMMFYAQQLPELDFAFILVGNRTEASVAIADARRLSTSLTASNASGDIKNLRFFHSPVPNFVASEKTYFATSRFFAASKLLKEYESVYIIDIDLQFNDDPRPFISWLRQRTFACSDNRGLYRLSPLAPVPGWKCIYATRHTGKVYHRPTRIHRYGPPRVEQLDDGPKRSLLCY